MARSIFKARTKKCKRCNKPLGSHNKSGYCSHHYRLWWKRNTVKGRAYVKRNFERQGYRVTLEKGDTEVELLPKRIILTFNSALSLRKDTTENYEKLKVILNNNLYELVGITLSILNLETTLGDSEITTYMNFYHDLKVEKKKQSDGTTIYILTDLNNEKKFQFASRSMAWRPGY